MVLFHCHRREGDCSRCHRGAAPHWSWITTQSTHRLRPLTRRRPTCSQTETPPLSAPNASDSSCCQVARPCSERMFERITNELTALVHPQGSIAREGHGREWSHADGSLSRNMAIKSATRSCMCEFGSQDCVSAFHPDTSTPLDDMRVNTVREEPICN